MSGKEAEGLGRILKHQSLNNLTLAELSKQSGVSISHLTRIENAQRFPSARVLNKIAAPLGFREDEILMLAGLLTPISSKNEAENKSLGSVTGLDPFVASALAQESVELQRAVLGILAILRSIAGQMKKKI
jgi:transcriptional regulator with XRE-family HTH domain